MLKKIIYQVLRHRHFWREAGFDELSELYVSTMFRSLSISLTGLFVPVYMHQLGYGLSSIFMLAAWYFTFRAMVLDLSAGYTVARIGPKHTMLIGYALLIVSTGLFLTLPSHAWPIWFLGGVWGASASFFFIPFHVGFSKVKHTRHGGKELGFMNMMEKIGSALGPIIGGLVATFFGAQYIFLVAAGFLLLGLVPLFRTAEAVKINQQLDFGSFNVQDRGRDFLSVMAITVENTLSLYLWPLFLGVFVLTGAAIYAKLGAISSASIVVSILSATTIGRLIDQKRGRQLLRTSATINAAVHLIRPFVISLPFALGVNLANEAVTPGYRMPYYKGLYDAADDLPGQRIVYLTSMGIMGGIAAATMWWFLTILTLLMSDRRVITVGFMIAACASLLIIEERFRALNQRHILGRKV